MDGRARLLDHRRIPRLHVNDGSARHILDANIYPRGHLIATHAVAHHSVHSARVDGHLLAALLAVRSKRDSR
jgi:hypothetical protein